MTDEQCEAIKARLDAATPGPWQRGVAGTSNVVCFSGDDVMPVARVQGIGNEMFIVSAPTDIAALVVEVERQAKEINRLRMDIFRAAKLLSDGTSKLNDGMKRPIKAIRNGA